MISDTFQLTNEIQYLWLLFVFITIMATLYSSVGHGGASGYLAVMAIWGLSPLEMRPAALTMNIAVTCWLLYRAKAIRMVRNPLFWPIAITSTPFALIGGFVEIYSSLHNSILAIVLIFSAWKLLSKGNVPATQRIPSRNVLMFLGAILGFLAGLTGIGGGIFLSPLLVLFRWCSIRESTSCVAGVILLNSIAGLTGYFLGDGQWPSGSGWLILAAIFGSFLGGELTYSRASSKLLHRILALVLVIASIKLLRVAL